VTDRCHENAVAESFFSSLKKECIKRRIYAARQEARSDVFEYIGGILWASPQAQ
jgi:putative transposase